MTTLSDTSPEIERLQVELMRQTPAWRKLYLVSQLNQTVRLLALSGLRQRYPQAGPEELNRRLADLLLGPELAGRAYGPEVMTIAETAQYLRVPLSSLYRLAQAGNDPAP